MRIMSTINVANKDLAVAVLLISSASVSVFYIWTMIHESPRHIEQPFGAKSKHRIIDPPVDQTRKTGKATVCPDHEEVKLKNEAGIIHREVHVEEYALRFVSKLTSYLKSSYRIEGDLKSLKLGNNLHVTIQARDSRGRGREEGGDFWFATLATKNNNSGTAGRVVDYDNGTYSVYFKVGWVGLLDLEITLVHPSQVATVLTNVIWHERDRVEWVGRFEAPNGSVSSNQRCVLRRQYVPLVHECLLAYPRSMGQTVLVCGQPSGGIPCDGLSVLYNNITIINQKMRYITRNYFNVFAGDYFKRRLLRGPRKLFVEEPQNQRESLISNKANLTTCQPDLPTPQYSLGYWEANLWHSLVCKTKTSWENPNEIGECLRGKKVYFLGDSTIRQWLELLSEMLGVPFKRQTLEEQNNIYRNFESFNISMTLRFHPLLLTSNPKGTRHRKLAFEVDVLDGLQNIDCNYVVAISAWAHFPQWTRNSYVERVGLLREAVLRLKTRCPDVKVVVTGPHAREHPSKESRIYHNDLIAKQLGEILEDAFSNTGALYLDLWDLNLGYPSSNTIHMPKAVIKGELNMFLSYVCGVEP